MIYLRRTRARPHARKVYLCGGCARKHARSRPRVNHTCLFARVYVRPEPRVLTFDILHIIFICIYECDVNGGLPKETAAAAAAHRQEKQIRPEHSHAHTTTPKLAVAMRRARTSDVVGREISLFSQIIIIREAFAALARNVHAHAHEPEWIALMVQTLMDTQHTHNHFLCTTRCDDERKTTPTTTSAHLQSPG